VSSTLTLPEIVLALLILPYFLLQLLGEDEVATLLNSKERVTAWIAAVKKATSPHFDEVHKMVYRAAARSAQRRQADTESDSKKEDLKRPISKL